MGPAGTRVLLVTADAACSGQVEAELAASTPWIELAHATALPDAEGDLAGGRFDAALVDAGLGPGALDRLLAAAPGLPVIVITPGDDDEAGTAALQRGAQDFITRNELTARLLARSIRHAREQAATRTELARRERYFRALTEHAYDIVVLLATSGEFLYQSPAVKRVLGYAPGELDGQNVLDLVHPDDRMRAAELLRTWPEGPKETDFFEFRLQHRDGGWKVVEALGRSLHGDPRSGIVVNARDVTERVAAEAALRRTEDQLRQAHKMEAVGRLAGGIAHDFNNVLTAIFGYTDLLLEQIPPGEEMRADVEEIRRAAERAAALTRQLLAFSRKQILQPRVIDLNEVAGSVERMLSRLVGADVKVVFSPGTGLWPVRADPGQIEQVLMNLSANARDAMPEGGELRIATANRVLGAGDLANLPGLGPGEYVTLTVRDTGPGVPENVRLHIFEPFFTTKAQGKGTGLGLATVYGIVKQSGGGIYLESGTGTGAAFTIYLPKAESAVQQPDPAPAGPLNGEP